MVENGGQEGAGRGGGAAFAPPSGHPLAVALRIMEVFPSPRAALEPGLRWAAALESPLVPGEGAAVEAALEALAEVGAGRVSPEGAADLLESWWREETDPGPARESGDAEARAARAAFLSRAAWWFPPDDPSRFVAGREAA